MRRSIILFVLCVTLGAIQALGQGLLFKNISSVLGLPSSEIYNVYEDSRHYIWISTEAGLCRFNGSQILLFDASRGLPEKTCYGICEHPRGMIWFITSKNRVLRFDSLTQKLVDAPFSASLRAQLNELPTSQLYSI